jgi:hypothetical protein
MLCQLALPACARLPVFCQAEAQAEANCPPVTQVLDW